MSPRCARRGRPTSAASSGLRTATGFATRRRECPAAGRGRGRRPSHTPGRAAPARIHTSRLPPRTGRHVWPLDEVVTLTGSFLQGYWLFFPCARYALLCSRTMSTRLPIARFTSIRCSPQLAFTCPFAITSPTMSSARGSAGSPCTVTSRYEPFSLDTHCAVNRPGTLTNGVSIGLGGVTHARGSADDPTILRPADARYACSSPLPPPSAAGFTHAACMPSPCTRPKREFAGGGIVERNDEYTMTHPVCVAAWQSGMC